MEVQSSLGAVVGWMVGELIGTIKQIFCQVLGQASLDSEEMSIVFWDIESITNSRHLTHISEDVYDLAALTSPLFLPETRECGVLDIDKVDTAYLRERYLYLQSVREDLRK